MTVARDFTWSTICALALTVSVAVLAVAGGLVMFVDIDGLDVLCVSAFAAMMAFAVLCANNAAAAALHALTRKEAHWPTLIPALICAAGFAVASNQGVHLGWAILAESAAHPDMLPDAGAVDAAALFLCFAKPAMSWVIEGRRAMDKEDVAEAEAAAARELAAIRSADQGRSAPPRQTRSRTEPAQPKSQQPAARGSEIAKMADRTRAKQMLAEGSTPWAAAKATGVPLTTCKRYKAELEAVAA